MVLATTDVLSDVRLTRGEIYTSFINYLREDILWDGKSDKLPQVEEKETLASILERSPHLNGSGKNSIFAEAMESVSHEYEIPVRELGSLNGDTTVGGFVDFIYQRTRGRMIVQGRVSDSHINVSAYDGSDFIKYSAAKDRKNGGLQ